MAIWRESTLFSPCERAALEWTDTLTQLPSHGVPDDLYERMRAHYSEKELSDLTFLVGAINSWNRLNIAFRIVPGRSTRCSGSTRPTWSDDMKRIMLVLAPLALSLLMPAQPAAAAPQARVTQLTTEPLPEYPGKEVR